MILDQSNAKKSRPYSAKFSTNTPKVDDSVRQSRIASAGTTRRTPFIRPSIRNSLANHAAKVANGGDGDQNRNTIQQNNWMAKPHTLNNTNAQQNNTAGNYSSYSNTNNVYANNQSTTSYQQSHINNGAPSQEDKLSSSVTAADIRKSLEGAVYDANGIRLDRTPTDEEINWLWDKVRTCLSRQSTSDSLHGDSQGDRVGSGVRQTAQVSNKYIDGANIAPQFRTSTRVSTNYTNGDINSTNATRKKISMDNISSYTRRVPSGTQRKSSAPPGTYSHTNGVTFGTTYTSPYNAYGTATYPAQAQQGPVQSSYAPISTVNGYNGEGNFSNSFHC